MKRLCELIEEHPDAVILTTEKDAVKLTNRKKVPEEVQKRLYYVPVRVAFLGDSEHDFIRQLKKYASSNQKYSILHPE